MHKNVGSGEQAGRTRIKINKKKMHDDKEQQLDNFCRNVQHQVENEPRDVHFDGSQYPKLVIV